MTFDYSSIQSTGLNLINKFGRDAVLKRVTEGTYNPSTGAITGDAITSETVKAVFTNYNESQIDGSIVQRGDRLILVSAKDITEPKTNDLIAGWKIISNEIIQTGDTPLIYKLQVRK